MGNAVALFVAVAVISCANARGPDPQGNGPDAGGGSDAAIPIPMPDACGDSDGDGVCNAVDKCPGHDDALDADSDTIADLCDVCPGADDRPDVNSNSVPDCSELQTRAIDLKVVDTNRWRGWHNALGGHSTTNDNTLTGLLSGNTYNSYFTFPLAGFTPGVITKVTLELQLEVYLSSDATETFSVWDVSTASSSVETTAPSTIFTDLQSGNQYAAVTINNSQVNQILSIPLGAQAITDITAKLGDDYLVGVHLDTPAATSNWIRFGNTGADAAPTVNRLVVEYLP